MVPKKKNKLVDPYAKREASKYDSPIASRELILEILLNLKAYALLFWITNLQLSCLTRFN